MIHYIRRFFCILIEKDEKEIDQSFEFHSKFNFSILTSPLYYSKSINRKERGDCQSFRVLLLQLI